METPPPTRHMVAPAACCCEALTKPYPVLREMETKPETYKRYFCALPGCSAAFVKQRKLDAHLATHTGGPRPFACERADCGRSFASAYHLARHELSHSGHRPFRCAVDGCGEAFTTNANRVRHEGRVHCADKRSSYACQVEGCRLEFRKHKQLRSHMCEQHDSLPPYQCPQPGCSRRFAFPSGLKRHEKVHRGYPCNEPDCDFVAKTWTEHLEHRKERHRLEVRCDRCDKVFRDSWFLKQHQRVHSETRMCLLCPWEGCSRSFTKDFNLESHIRAFHQELRPFRCDQPACGKTFAMKQSLQRHSVVHNPVQKKSRTQRLKRSLMSKLSGYKDKSGAVFEDEPSRGFDQTIELGDPVVLVPLLQDCAC
ncbi:transcription factor IIIA-like [Nelusetta ayraudi]|uniref:transcription factor IIIA-like n=1 Tax=Nelusetta ayraudi TaxID=303726 RepID=UPI003F70FBEC